MKNFKVVGKPLPRLDGPDSVNGRAIYTVDVALPEMLHVKLFRSSVPHAKIRRLDVSRARALNGVAAVLTADDVPAKRFGFGVQDEQLLAGDKVRYVGDVIAAVAAVDEATAEQALDLIDCDYEVLAAALTIDEALRENAPLVHEQLSSYRLNTVLARDWHPVFGTNIAHQTSFSKGDIDKGFAEADEIFDDTFRSQQVQHCSLEPHAVVAEWDGDRLTLWTSTQKVFLVRSGLADLFDLPEDKIRVIGSKVGAGFGGKNAMRLEPYAAALALKTGKPVRLVNSRAEEFFAAADVGGADKQFDLAIGGDTHACVGRRRGSGRRLVQQRDAKSMIRRRAFLPALELSADFHQTLAQGDMVGAIAGRSYVADIETIFQPKRDRIDTELLRNDIHLRFAGPRRFGYA